MASGAGSRAAKYRHLLDEAPGLSAAEQAVLAVLMLRGAQTPGELRQRTERMQRFEGAEALQETLETLIAREFVARLGRRPGQKEERFAHRLSDDLDETAPAPPPSRPAVAAPAGAPSPPPPSPPPPSAPAADRLDRLERRLVELEVAVADLREQLGG